jgi:hypothetical protein
MNKGIGSILQSLYSLTLVAIMSPVKSGFFIACTSRYPGVLLAAEMRAATSSG